MSGLELEHFTTARELRSAEWDACLGARGVMTVAGLLFLEHCFDGRNPIENRWRFHYYVVRDRDGLPVLSTFFTEALWKDDMFAAPDESRLAEQRREADPYWKTSLVLSMGSLLTEGNHLYLDRRREWRRALGLLLEDVTYRARHCGAGAVVLRDLPSSDFELDELLCSRGFIRQPMPDSMVIEVCWETEEDFLASRPRKRRREIRNKILKWSDAYDVEVLRAGGRTPASADLTAFYELYQNVKRRSLELNTFDLPEHLFEDMLRHPGWELIVLRLRNGFEGRADGTPVAVGSCFIGEAHYAPVVVGLDYRYVFSQALYRQTLWQVLRRALHLRARRIHFGMGAPSRRCASGRPLSRAVSTSHQYLEPAEVRGDIRLTRLAEDVNL